MGGKGDNIVTAKFFESIISHHNLSHNFSSHSSVSAINQNDFHVKTNLFELIKMV